jgi:adenosylmethionine-8-amino-7-oxononanoate aminotransferase
MRSSEACLQSPEAASLSPRQEDALSRPTAPRVDQLRDWDLAHHWHGFTQMAAYEPLIIHRAQGCWLETVDGRRLLDGCSSLWCNVHGHNHPRINAAIVEQLHRVAHVTTLGMACDTTVELAARLARLVPVSDAHVFYSSDGACSVEAALKMALQFWQQTSPPQPAKCRFLALGEAYHGDTVGSVSAGGIELFHQRFGRLLFECFRAPCPDGYRLPEGVTSGAATDHYLGEVERLLAAHAGQIAAIVMEPLVQGAAGMLMHPPGFLAGVRRLATKYDVLLVLDEVAVGCGRTGTMFACEQEDVRPDLLCLGKGLTGGYLPMAVTVADDRVFRAFSGPAAAGRQFFHGHTYGGNPLAAAAAIASLDLFEDGQTLAHVRRQAARLQSSLAPLSEHPRVGTVRQRGLMVGIELVQDRATGQRYPREQLAGVAACRRALERGVWIRPLGDVVVLMPPLVINDEELEFLAATVCDVL